jgi:hypothetical protein
MRREKDNKKLYIYLAGEEFMRREKDPSLNLNLARYSSLPLCSRQVIKTRDPLRYLCHRGWTKR